MFILCFSVDNTSMKIFKLSPFVDSQFNRQPELFELLDAELDLTCDWKAFQTQFAHLDIFSQLRKYRQSRLALIAAQDSQYQSLEQHRKTLNLTSQLARLMITAAYDFAANELSQRYGKVYDSSGKQQQLIIFALGKLGGNELNYSSDVDLVFCYSGSGQSDGRKCLDAESYFTRLGRRIIQLLDSQTSDGIVYRVDMRLRPFGSAAPLLCSTQYLLNYFEHEGRDWERYAWLRARFVAGNKQFAEQTLRYIEPFIYRKYLDYSVFDSLRQIKQQIERKQLNDSDNLKLGIGGIREIEFIVQTLQLTFAGRNQQLRGNDLWQQLHKLAYFKHIKETELQQLSAAWLFLRKLENLCQIIEDRDSHHLPQDKDKLANVAICMNLDTAFLLAEQLTLHKNNVHAIFSKLFIKNQSQKLNETKNKQIQAIKDNISKKNYPKSNKHKLYATWEAVEPVLSKYKHPEQIISRFEKVIQSVAKRASYLSMLIESPLILEKLVVQLSQGEYFSSAIAKTPSLLEILFEGITVDDFNMPSQWQFFCNKHSIHDAEAYIEALCQFKQAMQFRIKMAQVDEIINQQQAGLYLTQLAELILSHVVQQAWKETLNAIKAETKETDLIIIAYGSLATRTMHQHSDFDLVFVFNCEINENNHKFVVRWIKKIIHYLSIQTYFGSLYELDTQLRPNGQSGSAVVSKENFEQYQLQKAWLWEHAALIKSRAIYATKEQKDWFMQIRKKVLCQKRDAQDVTQQLAEMAKKLTDFGKKNHQKEFQQLGEILIQAHDNPSVIDIL